MRQSLPRFRGRNGERRRHVDGAKNYLEIIELHSSESDNIRLERRVEEIEARSRLGGWS